MDPKALALLGGAIVAELVATSSLKASAGFTRLWPSVAVVVGYAVAFYLLGLSLKVLPIGIAYAIWAGVGTAVIAVVGWLVYGERLSPPQIIGIALILGGTLLLHLTGGRAEATGG